MKEYEKWGIKRLFIVVGMSGSISKAPEPGLVLKRSMRIISP